MKFRIFLFLLMLLWAPQPGVTEEAKNTCNPKPLADDLVLPGPEGTCFVFRPVYVSGETVFDGSTFFMGDPTNENFRNPLVRVVVGGSFESDNTEKGSWMFYMGKYEVTRAQYRAVMGELPGKAQQEQATPETDALPVTALSYFDAINFADRLNQWLYANALDKMPQSAPLPGFIRLPSEIEWEFAARGGMAAEKSQFEAPTPYVEPLTQHEWFAGTSSSHGKLRQAGLLNPNPLGLHDMLGNVQEITSNHYQMDYYQGRSGGFAARGGHSFTDEKKIQVFMRTEVPYYSVIKKGAGETKMVPSSSPTLGMRLALSAPLLTNRETIAAFEEAWEGYKAGVRQETPAGLTVASTSAQEAVSMNDALARLQKLRGDSAVGKTTLLQELTYMEATLKEAQNIRRKADADLAHGWVRQVDIKGKELCESLNRELILDERVKASEGERQQMFSKRLREIRYNTDSAMNRYLEYLEFLDKLPATLVDQAFADRAAFLQGKISPLQQPAQAGENPDAAGEADALALQVAVSELARQHFATFNKEKRGDISGWRGAFISLLMKRETTSSEE